MRKAAVTGGIGSGKSFVCKRLEERGINVYDCDAAAKRLMHTSETIRRELQQTVGKEVYADGQLNKNKLAQFLLASEENKLKVNSIVHPAVAEDFEKSGMEWLESAILFESGFDKRVKFDLIVCVTAPLATRIRRIMQRDGISLAQALMWIHRQMPQREVRQRSQYIIINDEKHGLEKQIENMINCWNIPAKTD